VIEQALPQVPQLFGFALRLAQVPLQHCWLPGHSLPHAPQLSASVSGLEQTPPQQE